MKRIKLTQGIYALIDDEDCGLVSQYKWCVVWDKRRWYAVTGPDKKTKGKFLYMHRLIMKAQLGEEVDHKEHYGNYIDNQRSNLRICTHAENGHNHRKHFTYAGNKTSSQHKGVCWNNHAQKWQAHINMNGKSIYLGLFNDEIEAARAYNIGALQYFGEFAKLNEIEVIV